MKHLGKLAFGAMALMLASCSSDEPKAPSQGDNATGDFYASLNLRLPSAGGSRAGDTSYIGEEFGQDEENFVNSILVVLAKKNEQNRYEVVAYAQSDARPGSTNTDNKITYTLNFKSTALGTGDPINGNGSIAGQQVYVIAYCNPSSQLLQQFANNRNQVFDNFSTTLDDKDDALLWKSNHFLMANKTIKAPITIPDRKDLVDNYNTAEKAFPLGSVDVVRACARFDFKLGGENGDNKYAIKDIDDKEKTIGTVELTDMAMFNIQKNFFYLHRTNNDWNWTSSTGTDATNYTLCGDLEDYVMSYNLNNFKSKTLDETTRNNEFFCNIVGYDFKAENGSLSWISIRPEDWKDKKDDNHNSWDNGPTEQYPKYKIWRYATENTIPAATTGGATSNQKVGISTGVVFKAEFTPEDKTVWNNNVVYTYNNIVYGDFKKLATYVADNTNTMVAAAFKNTSAFKDVDPSTTDLKKNLFDISSTKEEHNGFTAYVPTQDSTDDAPKYRMYYFYYNRHDSNNDPSVMGDNEFGVVRNNVYKLCVTNISGFGQPTAPKNPDDPNEEENAYFTVSCTVWPWTVRVNNIDFY